MTAAAPAELGRRSRSGSNKRQRTQQVKLNLLPQEEQRLRSRAEQGGFPSVQAYILHQLTETAAI
jgi:hypothetical protein